MSAAPRSEAPLGVTAASFDAYLAEVEREAARALEQYGLLVVPGLELSYNDDDPRLSAHALALGLRSFVSVDEGIDGAIETAVQAGAALVAAHPYDSEPAPNPGRLTQRFARDPELAARVHRFELFNRHQLFSWVAKAGPPLRRERRLPPARAPARLEERRAVRPRRGGADRAPALAPPRLHHAGRRRDERAAA